MLVTQNILAYSHLKCNCRWSRLLIDRTSIAWDRYIKLSKCAVMKMNAKITKNSSLVLQSTWYYCGYHRSRRTAVSVRPSEDCDFFFGVTSCEWFRSRRGHRLWLLPFTSDGNQLCACWPLGKEAWWSHRMVVHTI